MKRLMFIFLAIVSMASAQGLIGESWYKADSIWGRSDFYREYKRGSTYHYSDEKSPNQYSVSTDLDNKIQRVTITRTFYDTPVHLKLRYAPWAPWTAQEVKAFMETVAGPVKWKGTATAGSSEDGTLSYRVNVTLDANNRIDSAEIVVSKIGFELGAPR